MGVFSDQVRKYYEAGLVTIPCHAKAPKLMGWQRYCTEIPTEHIIETLEKDFSEAQQIGLTLGPANNLCAFDFDYEYNEKKSTLSASDFKKDYKVIEKQILGLLPQTPCIKVGKKGWTRLYRLSMGVENKCVNRNGVRLFDLLAKGRQTIIPPSHYGDPDNTTYKWLAEPIQDCIDDLPVLTKGIVEEITHLFGEAQGSDFNTRHGKLFTWLCNIIRLEPDEEKIIDQLLIVDKSINTPAYLTDPKYYQNKDPRKTATEWIKRIRRFLSVEKNKNPKITEIGWDYFFEHALPEAKKDILTDKIYVRRDKDSRWVRVENIEGVLRSYAGKKGLAVSKTKDELERWIFEKTKTELLIDIPEWDGTDRIQKLAESIHSPSFTHNELAEIISDWGAKIFHRIYSGGIAQNRCPILKGDQGIGKDTWVKAMISDFDFYYESVNLSGSQKDMLEIVSRLLIIHVEEFDQTANVPIAFLKDIITKNKVFFREAYAKAPDRREMMASWISTANVDDVLRDPSGNRRFILIPVDRIDWGYPQGESRQVIAQFYALYKQKPLIHSSYTSLETEKKIAELLRSYTPDDVQTMVIESYKQRIDARCKYDQTYKFSYPDIEHLVSEIAKNLGITSRRVLSIIKSAGYQRRNATERYYTDAPDNLK